MHVFISLQSYMQRKRTERRRTAQQKQEASEKENQRKRKKMKNLYETQRRKIENNLCFKQQTESLTRTSSASASLHIHLQDTSELVSTNMCPGMSCDMNARRSRAAVCDEQ